MSQEQTEENFSVDESASDSPEKKLNPAEAINDSSVPAGSEEIDKLPIESIGSYARIEELLTDEDSENISNPTAQS